MVHSRDGSSRRELLICAPRPTTAPPFPLYTPATCLRLLHKHAEHGVRFRRQCAKRGPAVKPMTGDAILFWSLDTNGT